MLKKRKTASVIWSCITLFYCYQYLLRVMPNIIMSDILSKFNVGASEFGLFAGIYYIGYVIVHIPIGIMISHFGAKRILPIFIIITALGALILNYSNSWYIALFSRFLTGIGSSAAAVGTLQVLRILYPNHFSKMVGLTVCLGLITVVYTGHITSSAISIIGFEKVINILFAIGCILAVSTYLIMPKFSNAISHGTILDDVKSVLFDYRIILLSFLAGLMVGPLEGFADAWGTVFLSKVYNINKIVADNYVLSILLGMCTGCVILPYIAESTKRYYLVTIFSGIIMFLCFSALIFRALQDYLYHICVLIGICSAYQVVIIPRIAEFASVDKIATAAALANMIIMSFGSIFHSAIGKSFAYFSKNVVLDYDVKPFLISISIIPIAILIAVIGMIIFVTHNHLRGHLRK